MSYPSPAYLISFPTAPIDAAYTLLLSVFLLSCWVVAWPAASIPQSTQFCDQFPHTPHFFRSCPGQLTPLIHFIPSLVPDHWVRFG